VYFRWPSPGWTTPCWSSPHRRSLSRTRIRFRRVPVRDVGEPSCDWSYIRFRDAPINCATKHSWCWSSISFRCTPVSWSKRAKILLRMHGFWILQSPIYVSDFAVISITYSFITKWELKCSSIMFGCFFLFIIMLILVVSKEIWNDSVLFPY